MDQDFIFILGLALLDKKPKLSCSLHVVPKHPNNRLEGKPFWNVLPSPQSLAELSSTEALLRQILCFSFVSGDISLLLGVHEVERGDSLDSKLVRGSLEEILGVVGSVEIIAGNGGL